MKRTLCLLTLLTLSGLMVAPLAIGQPPSAGKLAGEPLTADEHKRLLKHLDQSQSLFLDSVAFLSEAQWKFKPAEDRWSIAECAEHVAISEKFIRDSIAEMMKQPASADKVAEAGGKVDGVIETMADRSQKFQAPEPVAPSARWETMEDTLKAFRKERGETLELAEEGENLHSFTAEHPGFGELDAYGWLFFLSSHTVRHTQQIEEVKADPSYPKS